MNPMFYVFLAGWAALVTACQYFGLPKLCAIALDLLGGIIGLLLFYHQ